MKLISSLKVIELKNKNLLRLDKNSDINLCIECLISDKNDWIAGQNITLEVVFL